MGSRHIFFLNDDARIAYAAAFGKSRLKAIDIEFHADSRRKTEFDSIMQQYGFGVIDSGHTTLAIRKQ